MLAHSMGNLGELNQSLSPDIFISETITQIFISHDYVTFLQKLEYHLKPTNGILVNPCMQALRTQPWSAP